MYSDGRNGRCAVGVLMSYYGWDGLDDLDVANNLVVAREELKLIDIEVDLLIHMNDSGFTFDEIANYIDRVVK